MGWGCWGCFRPIRIVADSEYLMNDSFQQRMEAIDWSRYETAYGPAVRVPGQLWLLAKGGPQGGNGRQPRTLVRTVPSTCLRVFGSAACLAVPPRSNGRRGRTVGRRDPRSSLGFAVCTNPQVVKNIPLWIVRLREQVCRETPRFRRLSGHPNEEIKDFAGHILEELAPGHAP